MNGVIVDGRYEVIKILGGGAFGQTFLSKDTKRPGHPYCVIKQLRYSHSNPQALQHARRLFKKEAEILEKLGHHDQIPTLLADIEEGQEFFLVEQFVPGHPLTQEMIPGVPWSEEQVRRFLQEALEILVFVHGQGVIHRDIKPANLMRRQPDDKLVLIDFGAVKELGTQIALGQNTPTIAIGTPGYMAIEQFNGQPQFNSDIYALGIIAIQALLGLAADEISLLKDSSSHPPGEVKWRDRRSISPVLADVIDNMVRLDHRQRYATAAAVLADLANLNEPGSNRLATTVLPNIQAVPPSIPTILATATPEHIAGQPSVPSRETSLPAASHANANSVAAGSVPSMPSGSPSGLKRFLAATAIALITLGSFAGIGYSQKNRVATYFHNQGRQKARFGEIKAALDRYNLAIQINPAYADAYARRCGMHLRLEDNDRAEADCQRALDLDPDNPIAHLNWGNFYTEQRNREEANTYYTRAVALSSRDIQLDPNNADAYYHRGAARFRLADRPGAIEDVTKAIELDPEYVEAYIARCQAQGQMREHQKAVEDCTKATEINPNNYTAYVSLCNNLSNLGQHDAAIEACTRALQLNPNDSYGYNNRGLVWERLGNYESALNDYQQAIQRDPNDAVAHHNLGNVLTSQGNHQGALEAYTKATEIDPNFAAAFYGRGIRQAVLGNIDAAIADLQQSANLFSQQGRPDRVEDALYQIRRIQEAAAQSNQPQPEAAEAAAPTETGDAAPTDTPAPAGSGFDDAATTAPVAQDPPAPVFEAPPSGNFGQDPPAFESAPVEPPTDSFVEEPPTYDYNFEAPPADSYVQDPPAPYAAPAPFAEDPPVYDAAPEADPGSFQSEPPTIAPEPPAATFDGPSTGE
jgi:serine/threonine protein kinase/regulator of sirC expression with transglutaminase-like and TPR domain